MPHLHIEPDRAEPDAVEQLRLDDAAVLVARGLDADQVSLLARASGKLVVELGPHAGLEALDEDTMARHGWVRTSSDVGRLRYALRDLLGLFLDAAYSDQRLSGDPEIIAEVQRARAALRDVGVEEQVGWVRYDGDEYHDFRYAAAVDRRRHGQITEAGYLPVYARRLA